MNGLQVELSGFRAEMKEFKTAVEKRMDCLDNRSTACQFNPNVCATARRLEEHMKNDAPSIDARFVEFCNVLERIYKHIHFYGGYRKFDEKNLQDSPIYFQNMFDKIPKNVVICISIDKRNKIYSQIK